MQKVRKAVIDPAFQVTAVVTHTPTRAGELLRAVRGIVTQIHPARNVVIAADLFDDGLTITRNRPLLGRLDTTWVAFCDEDDEWLPNHLETLTRAAAASGAQVIYSEFVTLDRDGFRLPRPAELGCFGAPFDPDLLRGKSCVPVTSLVRAELAHRALFGPPTTHWVGGADDVWGFYLRLLQDGAKFHHVSEVTSRHYSA